MSAPTMWLVGVLTEYSLPLCGEIVNIIAFLQKITDVNTVSDSLGHIIRFRLYKAMVKLRFGQAFRSVAAEHLGFPKLKRLTRSDKP